MVVYYKSIVRATTLDPIMWIDRFLTSPHLKKLFVLGLLIANVVDEFKKDKEIIELRNS